MCPGLLFQILVVVLVYQPLGHMGEPAVDNQQSLLAGVALEEEGVIAAVLDHVFRLQGLQFQIIQVCAVGQALVDGQEFGVLGDAGDTGGNPSGSAGPG